MDLDLRYARPRLPPEKSPIRFITVDPFCGMNAAELFSVYTWAAAKPAHTQTVPEHQQQRGVIASRIRWTSSVVT